MHGSFTSVYSILKWCAVLVGCTNTLRRIVLAQENVYCNLSFSVNGSNTVKIPAIISPGFLATLDVRGTYLPFPLFANDGTDCPCLFDFAPSVAATFLRLDNMWPRITIDESALGKVQVYCTYDHRTSKGCNFTHEFYSPPL